MCYHIKWKLLWQKYLSYHEVFSSTKRFFLKNIYELPSSSFSRIKQRLVICIKSVNWRSSQTP